MPSNEEILNYVMNTPNNTNPAVLRDMLNNNNSGGNPGYDVETVTKTIIPEQTVTLTLDEVQKVAVLTLASDFQKAPETMTIVFEGESYEATAEAGPFGDFFYNIEGGTIEGGITIQIASTIPSATIIGPVTLPDSVTVEAHAFEKVVTVTDEFKAAVDAAAGSGTFFIGIEFDGDKYTMRETWATIMAASAAGKSLVGVYQDGASATTYYPIIQVAAGEDSYMVRALGSNGDDYGLLDFMTDTEDGYPKYGGLA